MEICNDCYDCQNYYLNNDEVYNCQGAKEKCHEFIEVKSFEEWWNNDLDDIEREEYSRAIEEYSRAIEESEEHHAIRFIR